MKYMIDFYGVDGEKIRTEICHEGRIDNLEVYAQYFQEFIRANSFKISK